MNTTFCRIWALSGLTLALACQPGPAVAPDEGAGMESALPLSAQAALIPRITAVSPPLASNLGGATLTLTGRNFQPGIQVLVAGQPVAYTSVLSSSQLQLQLPRGAYATGAAAVKVMNPDGRASERSDVLTLFADSTSLAGLRTPVSLSSLSGGGQVVGAADFDGDGLVDVLGQDYSRLYLLRSCGRGCFAESQTLDGLAGGMPGLVEIADVTGDGKPDVVSSTVFGSAVLVYPNRGDGTLGTPVLSTLSAVSGYYGSTVADVNKDGRADLLLVTSTFGMMSPYSLSVFFGGTDGRFASTPVSTGLSEAPRLLSRDVNGDGHADILTWSSARGEIGVLVGNSSGSFTAAGTVTVDSPTRELAVADLNGDGKLDLASLGGDGKLSLRVGRGDGSFSGTGLLTVASGAQTLAVADLTGDGKVDVVVGSDRSYPPAGGAPIPGGAWLLRGNGDATLQPPQEVSLFPLWGVNRLRVVDADRDGKSDILAFGDSMVLPIYGRGGGLFFEDRQFPAAINAVATRDVNGDSKGDIIATAVAANKVYVALNSGDGTSAAPRAFDTDKGPAAVAVADVSGDGKVDLIVANYDAGTVSVLPGNGDGSFQPQRIFPVAYGANALVIADLNNDTRPDIVTANYESNNVSVLINSGMGAFATAKNYATSAAPAALVAIDFNKDGRMDIVTANPDSNNLSYLQGSAVTAGALNAARLLTTGRGPIALAAADVTGDGNADLISGNADSGDVTLLTGRGDGTVAASSVVASPGRVVDLVLADVTGDGRADLVVATGSLTGGSTGLFYGFAGGVFAPSARTIGYAGPLAIGDLTGDGRRDLLIARLSGLVMLHESRGL
ncbi:MAG TPA: FG-GAP-like repeat-containing protein [Pseudomonadota bacterium]|nr:FG-GAP-like repeat-containing protein [Pseudomonadota bacterium]